MLFDIINATASRDVELKSLCKAIESRRNCGFVAADFWGEHCIECGMPACYATCEKFLVAPNGKCRRFVNGILPLSDQHGRRIYAIRFLPWSKLELHYHGRVISTNVARFVASVDAFISLFLPSLNRWLFKSENRRNLINCYCLVRDWFVRAIFGRDALPKVWRISCYARAEDELMCTIVQNGSEIFVSRWKLTPGMNQLEVPLKEIKDGALFRIFSINGCHSDIIFTEVFVGIEDGSSPNAKIGQTSPSVVKNPSEYVKCVAWDLDNTLWKGILVNDGPDGISLRMDIVDLIKTLDKKGIVNTICSKNDYTEAWKRLQEFGLDEYFVFPKINWNPKSANLIETAKEMNIGLDTFAFVDDSVHERAEVSDHAPCVRVFDERSILLAMQEHCFDSPISTESAGRRKTYKEEMKRRAAASIFTGTPEEFLRAAQIVLTLVPVSDPLVGRRCWELVNRTNQLTLAAHRYDESAFQELIGNSEYVYAVRCADKYGDYGVVGFLSVARSGSRAEITEFVMSCRVAKKKCEQSTLCAVAEKLFAEGVSDVVAKVVETGRNRALVEAFDAMPFIKTKTSDGLVYCLDVKTLDATRGACFRNEVLFE